jgi:hypothetical protein
VSPGDTGAYLEGDDASRPVLLAMATPPGV